MKKKGGDGESDDVEQLLQSAQDELLLKLSLDSHISHVAGVSPESDHLLLPDLHRRFQALKPNPSKLQQQPPIPPLPPPHQPNIDEQDLLARFAALKQKSSSSSSSINNTSSAVGAVADRTGFCRGDGSDEEDEVEKIIRWAKDAARLDPSPSSDEDEKDEADEDEDEEEDEDEDDDEDDDGDKAGVSRRIRK